MPLNIIQQDITTLRCDAIVSPTNSDMMAYGGVDLMVHSKAGPGLDEECRGLAPLEPGFAKISGGYNLLCRYIIHTVGPTWRGGQYGERAVLRSCYIESLKLAKEHGCESVAFPLISAGTYGYPKDQVLKHAVSFISDFLQDNDMTVYLCVYSRSAYEFDKTLSANISAYLGRRSPRSRDLDFDIRRFSRRDSAPIANVAPCFDMVPDEEDAFECRPMADMLHSRPSVARPSMPSTGMPKQSLGEFLKEKKTDGFSGTLFAMIDKSGMSDVECYKRANVDKKVFSKIKCNANYKPSKPTALAFAIALKLDLKETNKLLASAGLALSHGSDFDMIIEYFILHKNYNIFEINESLFEFDQPLLGC